MLSGRDVAQTSSNARGCTFKSELFCIDIDGVSYNMWDTAGLDESNAGTVPTTEAILQLFRLLKNLETGVNLLAFCVRGSRIKDSVPKNWLLFHEIICQKKVPIVMLITGLEEEDNMDNWWTENKDAFGENKMYPAEVACITAIRGKQLKNGGYRYEEEYEESKMKVQKLLKAHCLKKPWRVQAVEWFSTIVDVVWEERLCRLPKQRNEFRRIVGPGIRGLVDFCGMSEAEAKVLGEKLARS